MFRQVRDSEPPHTCTCAIVTEYFFHISQQFDCHFATKRRQLNTAIHIAVPRAYLVFLPHQNGKMYALYVSKLASMSRSIQEEVIS